MRGVLKLGRLSLKFFGLSLGGLATVFGCASAFAAPCAHTDMVESTEKLPNGVSVRMTLLTTLEALATVSIVSENMTLSKPVPLSVNVSSSVSELGRPRELLRAEQNDVSQTYRWRHSIYFMLGNSGGRHDSRYVYALPYSPGESHLVLQGYNGTHSHNAETQDTYSLDFEMPEGTVVCAAREGQVIAYKSDSNEGGVDKIYSDCANYIVVKHSDGTYATYCHLHYGGVLVKLGQRVARGQQIGISGRTGWATAPHLHFSVFQPIDGLHKITIPTRFATSRGVIEQLEQGRIYEQAAFTPGRK